MHRMVCLGLRGLRVGCLLQVEMLSHFGSQHYCPLSLFRVFGVSMVEEYEDHESGSHDSDTAGTRAHHFPFQQRVWGKGGEMNLLGIVYTCV